MWPMPICPLQGCCSNRRARPSSILPFFSPDHSSALAEQGHAPALLVSREYSSRRNPSTAGNGCGRIFANVSDNAAHKSAEGYTADGGEGKGELPADHADHAECSVGPCGPILGAQRHTAIFFCVICVICGQKIPRLGVNSRRSNFSPPPPHHSFALNMNTNPIRCTNNSRRSFSKKTTPPPPRSSAVEVF